ncbi:MAG: hypothetical protein ACI8PT_003070 [Gammaproteobacteria bacterium]|jgi:hypothetical protein
MEIEPHRVLDDMGPEPMATRCVGASIPSRSPTQRQPNCQFHEAYCGVRKYLELDL